MIACCQHCKEFLDCIELGKYYLCEEHKDLKQYQQKEKKNYTLKRTPIKVNKDYRIPQVSKKQSKAIREYSPIAKKFKEDNPLCVVNVNGCTRKTNDVHHKMGKVGYANIEAIKRGIKLLVDVRYFLPVCRNCHTYIESNSGWAYEKGYSLKRNEI